MAAKDQILRKVMQDSHKTIGNPSNDYYRKIERLPAIKGRYDFYNLCATAEVYLKNFASHHQSPSEGRSSWGHVKYPWPLSVETIGGPRRNQSGSVAHYILK